MALSTIVLLCESCNREFVIPRHRLAPGTPCRGCGNRLPDVGVVLTPGDSELGELLKETTSPVFVALHAGAEMSAEGIRQLHRVARSFGNRSLIMVSAAARCPQILSTCQITALPAYVFVQSSVWLAMLQGQPNFVEAVKWMLATMDNYAMPPLTAKPAPCLRCGGRTLIRCLPVEQGLVGGTDITSIRFRRMAVTHAASTTHEREFGKIATRQDPDAAAGKLEAFVCRSCGHTEWFAADPANIPIGPQHRTELVQVGDTNPYR